MVYSQCFLLVGVPQIKDLHTLYCEKLQSINPIQTGVFSSCCGPFVRFGKFLHQWVQLDQNYKLVFLKFSYDQNLGGHLGFLCENCLFSVIFGVFVTRLIFDEFVCVAPLFQSFFNHKYSRSIYFSIICKIKTFIAGQIMI